MPSSNKCRNLCKKAPRRDADKINNRNLLLAGFPQPPVVCGVWIGPHERVLNQIVALVDLTMDLTLVVVPDLRTWLWEDGADGQQVMHLPWLEDSALRIHQRDAIVFKKEPFGELLRGKVVMRGIKSAHVLKRCRSHAHVKFEFHYVDRAPPIFRARIVVSFRSDKGYHTVLRPQQLRMTYAHYGSTQGHTAAMPASASHLQALPRFTPSIHMIKLRHRLEHLPAAPRAGIGPLVHQLAADDGVEHTRAQDLVVGDGQQIAGEHHHVGQLAGGQ